MIDSGSSRRDESNDMCFEAGRCFVPEIASAHVHCDETHIIRFVSTSRTRIRQVRIDWLQNRAVRIITKSGYEVRSVNLLHQLGLPNLEERRNQQLNTLMYKVRHEMAPSSLSNMFQKTNEVHEHRTRQAKHDFLPPKPKTNYLKKAFSYRGAVAWNNLPSEIKNSETVNIFKAKLKIIN